jgi:hypothetical protein
VPLPFLNRLKKSNQASRQIRHPQDEGQVQKEVWIGDLDTLKKATLSGGLCSMRLTSTMRGESSADPCGGRP